MTRYIDADALTENINNLSVMLCGKELFGELAKHSVTQMIDEHPTADVVPRAVIAEIFADIERLLAINFCSCLSYLPSGAAEHHYYFEGDLAVDVAEIKKKYTEEISE